LGFSGCQYRIHGENEELISWVCVPDKCGKCKGKIETNLQYDIFSKTENSCFPKLAGIEVKVKLENGRGEKIYVRRVRACTYNL